MVMVGQAVPTPAMLAITALLGSPMVPLAATYATL